METLVFTSVQLLTRNTVTAHEANFASGQVICAKLNIRTVCNEAKEALYSESDPLYFKYTYFSSAFFTKLDMSLMIVLIYCRQTFCYKSHYAYHSV